MKKLYLQKLLFLSFLVLPLLAATQTHFPPLPPVFKDGAVPRVDIYLPKDSLSIMLAPGNLQSDYHWHATFIFNSGELRDTVQNVGFRLRGNTSRNSRKKSFKVSFNTYAAGRKWQGLEKLNLNGEHNDPSIARSKICWDMLRWMEIPASRSNHVVLYINGNYFGLYINVEHVDEVFVQSRFGNNDGNLYKCLWPADLTYKGPDPNLYKQVSGGRRAYELMTNTEKDDYSDLANFIKILNNTPANNLPCELEKVFNVDAYLKAIAFDVLTANWDGPIYNKNNFYLYNNQATGKFEYIPYDLDNTFGIDWFKVNWATRNIYAWQHPTEPRPIFQRLMLVDEYSNRYSYYLNKYIEQFFNKEYLTPYLDSMRARIAPFAINDPYRPLDYGFSYDQFLKSFEETLPFNHTPWGIKPFVNTRKSTALQQLFLSNINPIIRNIRSNSPTAKQDLLVQAELEDDGILTGVELCYQWSEQSLTCIPMYDDGKHGDENAGDGVYGIIVPARGVPDQIEYYIKATDNSFRQSRQPLCGFLKTIIAAQTIPLVINELLASNQKTIADEAGQYDDWVEILNTGSETINLGNLFLSDSEANPMKWKFPNRSIKPMEYLIVWTDDDVNQGPLHTNFKLSAAGEYIGIFDAAGKLIDGIKFGQQNTDISYGRLPNGTGPFQALKPTPGAVNTPLTNVSDTKPKVLLSISPNPFHTQLTIALNGSLTQGATITIYDVMGKVILKDNLGSGTKEQFWKLDCKPGVYFLTMTTSEGHVETHKLIRGN